mgnify:CR=1 FL=1
MAMDINQFASDPRVAKSEKIVNVNLQPKPEQTHDVKESIMKQRQQLAPEGFDQEKASHLRGENVGGGRTRFVPESLGFHDAPREEHVDDVTKALETFDNEVLPRKQAEVQRFNDTIEAAGSVTEREWNEMNGIGYVNDAIDNPKRVTGALKTYDMTEEETKAKYEAEQEYWKAVDEAAAAQKEENNPEQDNFGLDLDNLNLPYDEEEIESMDNDIFGDEDKENKEEETIMEETKQTAPITTPKSHTEMDEVVEEIEDVKTKRETKSYTMVPNDNIESNDSNKEVSNDDIVIPESNPVDDIEEELEKELMEDDDMDKLEEDGETDEEIQERFKKSVIEKVKPVTKKFDISTFSIANKKIPFSNATKSATTHYRSAKWALMSTGRPITMRSFKSTELDALSNTGNEPTRYMSIKKMYNIIFDHIMDPKPKDVEEWAKVNSFLDLEHIWFAIYRACFEGSNFIPTDCSDTVKCRNVFLSDNVPIKDNVKFADENAKKKFNRIINSDSNVTSLMYTSEVIPVSDDYAIAFKEPSIYNVAFESALLDEDFIEKHQDLVSIISYIDKIYKINHEAQTLEEIDLPVFPNNKTKTFKTKVLNYAKVIGTLDSDQYRFILTVVDQINKRGDELTYVYPEMSCPKCGATIPERRVNAQRMVFLRHQLVALAL